MDNAIAVLMTYRTATSGSLGIVLFIATGELGGLTEAAEALPVSTVSYRLRQQCLRRCRSTGCQVRLPLTGVRVLRRLGPHGTGTC